MGEIYLAGLARISLYQCMLPITLRYFSTSVQPTALLMFPNGIYCMADFDFHWIDKSPTRLAGGIVSADAEGGYQSGSSVCKHRRVSYWAQSIWTSSEQSEVPSPAIILIKVGWPSSSRVHLQLILSAHQKSIL
jgi:hypothetical protein